MKLPLFLFLVLCFESLAQLKNFEGRKKINGTNLYLNIRGKGDYLLVLHGGPGLNHSYFLPHLQSLEKDFSVVYYDQRACGQSAIPSADSISMAFFVEDIEAIRKMLKTEKLNIIAHSWGAVLATRYGMQYPDHIKKLVFSSPSMLSREYDKQAADLIRKKTTKQDSTDRAGIMARGKLAVNDYEELFLLSFRSSAYNRSNISKININLPSNFSEANNALFTGLSKDKSLEASLYDSLASLRFPVLIIHGDSDVLPPAAIERLKKEIPHARLEILKRSGHFPFVEEKANYCKLLLRFLNDVE